MGLFLAHFSQFFFKVHVVLWVEIIVVFCNFNQQVSYIDVFRVFFLQIFDLSLQVSHLFHLLLVGLNDPLIFANLESGT